MYCCPYCQKFMYLQCRKDPHCGKCDRPLQKLDIDPSRFMDLSIMQRENFMRRIREKAGIK